ncbi:MAG: hypothetical protein IPP37_12265 [Saprospiraceae bacterium]|nr:hypothetical protein [Saprospiraceae bacterium]
MAKEQYKHYQTHFVGTTFGLLSVSEYPNGHSGDGDIDSGPVIFGVGFAATIVSIGTHAALGNIRSADDQFNTINAFGFPFQSSNTKSYLFGQLPIADAFIAWSLCGNLMTELTALPFRTPFHLLSLFFILWAGVLFIYSTEEADARWEGLSEGQKVILIFSYMVKIGEGRKGSHKENFNRPTRRAEKKNCK